MSFDLEGLTRELLDEAFLQAQGAIPTFTGHLKDDLKAVLVVPGQGFLQVTPYYAVFVHDGHPGGTKSDGAYVWYVKRVTNIPDPAADPRFKGNQTPFESNKVRSLTRKEFRRDLARGILRVRKTRAAMQAVGFFDDGKGMAGFADKASKRIAQRWGEFVQKELGGTKKIRRTITL